MKENIAIARYKLIFEFLWLLLACLVCTLVMLPIITQTRDYPFYVVNSIFIIGFFVLFRYTFFLQHSFIGRMQYLKLALIFLSLPLVWQLISYLNGFITYIDDHSYESILSHLSHKGREKMEVYIKTEMIFFGVASIVIGILFPFRLLISIWRVRNKGTI
jgi:hypothetical protein